jgi:hypothetical protein
MGATPAVADALDPSAVMNAVRQAKPEIVVHELTSIRKVDLRNFDQGFAATNSLRTEGTDNLLAAARAAGCAVSSRKALRVGPMHAREAR